MDAANRPPPLLFKRGSDPGMHRSPCNSPKVVTISLPSSPTEQHSPSKAHTFQRLLPSPTRVLLSGKKEPPPSPPQTAAIEMASPLSHESPALLIKAFAAQKSDGLFKDLNILKLDQKEKRQRADEKARELLEQLLKEELFPAIHEQMEKLSQADESFIPWARNVQLIVQEPEPVQLRYNRLISMIKEDLKEDMNPEMYHSLIEVLGGKEMIAWITQLFEKQTLTEMSQAVHHCWLQTIAQRNELERLIALVDQ